MCYYNEHEHHVRLRINKWLCCTMGTHLLASHRTGLDSHPGQSMWSMWLTQWHWHVIWGIENGSISGQVSQRQSDCIVTIDLVGQN
jgi:hypothetical protein